MSATPESPSTAAVSAPSRGLGAWIALCRPRQWTKNGFVLAPLLFSGRALEPLAVERGVLAFVAFCLAASAVYAFNDVLDAAEDRIHPVKCRRPVAAGLITPAAGNAVAAGLAVAALLCASLLPHPVLLLLGAYLALNLAYTLVLKRMVLLDVFSVASFFVLRLLVGSAANELTSSMWLLVCGGLLALFLGFAKRRHELTVLGEDASRHRGVLGQYSTAMLDQISSILLAVTIVAYLMYTLSSETAQRVGSEALSYGLGFVLFGVFRYLFLIHRRDLGTPSEILFEDRPLLLTVLLWSAYSGWLIYRPG